MQDDTYTCKDVLPTRSLYPSVRLQQVAVGVMCAMLAVLGNVVTVRKLHIAAVAGDEMFKRFRFGGCALEGIREGHDCYLQR
jgi:hypothetical protein